MTVRQKQAEEDQRKMFRMFDIGYTTEQVRKALHFSDAKVKRARKSWRETGNMPRKYGQNCKDCKHYQFADNRAFGMPVKMCKWFGFEDVDDGDFCSRAERRTDG